jgi:hypothetical protein
MEEKAPGKGEGGLLREVATVKEELEDAARLLDREGMDLVRSVGEAVRLLNRPLFTLNPRPRRWRW